MSHVLKFSVWIRNDWLNWKGPLYKGNNNIFGGKSEKISRGLFIRGWHSVFRPWFYHCLLYLGRNVLFWRWSLWFSTWISGQATSRTLGILGNSGVQVLWLKVFVPMLSTLRLVYERHSFARYEGLHRITHHGPQESSGVQKGNCLADLVDTGSVLRCRLGRWHDNNADNIWHYVTILSIKYSDSLLIIHVYIRIYIYYGIL